VLAAVRHDVYHRPGYVGIEAERLGGEAVAFVAVDQDRHWAVPLLLRPIPGTGRFDASSPYGYPGPISDAPSTDALFFEDGLASLAEALDDLGVVSCFLRLHPLLSPPLESFKRAGLLIVHGPTVVIDLSRSEEELWTALRGNHRTQVRRAHRAGVVAAEDVGWKRLDEFVAIYWATMERVGASKQYYLTHDYFDALRRSLGESAHLLVVSRDDELLAGGIYTECDGIVQYHLGATASEHLRLNPAKVMFDHATRWARRRGNQWLHLGGGVGGVEDALFHFKAGFSPLRRTYATWRLVVDRDAYDRLAGDGSAGAEQASFFPAYRADEGADGGVGRRDG
jgi:hypothetical protein